MDVTAVFAESDDEDDHPAARLPTFQASRGESHLWSEPREFVSNRRLQKHALPCSLRRSITPFSRTTRRPTRRRCLRSATSSTMHASPRRARCAFRPPLGRVDVARARGVDCELSMSPPALAL